MWICSRRRGVDSIEQEVKDVVALSKLSSSAHTGAVLLSPPHKQQVRLNARPRDQTSMRSYSGSAVCLWVGYPPLCVSVSLFVKEER